MDRWTKDRNGVDFHSGLLAWDGEAKETVRISNGKCTLDHSGPAGFAESHSPASGGCIFAPSEAVAVRVVDWVQTKKGARPVIGFTYRGVKPEYLSVLCFASEERARKAAANFPWPDGARFTTGRV